MHSLLLRLPTPTAVYVYLQHTRSHIVSHGPPPYTYRRTTRARTQIVPTASNGVDAVNFRQMQESTSLHLERQHSSAALGPQAQAQQHFHGLKGGAADGALPGTPGLGADDGMDVSPADADLFGAFSSITLHYDDES